MQWLAVIDKIIYFLAPVAAFLIQLYSARAVAMIGGTIACLGYLISAFSNSLGLTIISFGLCVGKQESQALFSFEAT